jgi:hypothetical protein
MFTGELRAITDHCGFVIREGGNGRVDKSTSARVPT